MTTLTWDNIWNELGLTRDNGGRWTIGQSTPKAVAKYIEDNGYRTPSRKWPHSHAKPLLTAKFAKHLKENDPELAEACGL